MKLIWIIITYWVINISIITGVLLQTDATAKQDAATWFIYASTIFIIGVFGTVIANRKKK